MGNVIKKGWSVNDLNNALIAAQSNYIQRMNSLFNEFVEAGMEITKMYAERLKEVKRNAGCQVDE